MAFCGAKFDDAKEERSPTVLAAVDFDPEVDAKVLYKAMKGFGTDEKKIINVVANRSFAQLNEVEKKFQTMYGEDLLKWLQKELKGKFEDVVIGRFYGPRGYSAYVLRKAMKGVGTDEDALIDVICTKNPHEMQMINRAYTALFKRDLVKDIQSETSGDFRRILVSLVTGGREEKPVDIDLANQEAKKLYDAGEGSWGTDETTFNMIFANRSFPQLRATFYAYKKLKGKDMLDVVNSEMSKNMKRAFSTMIRYINDPIEYYSEELYRSMKGLGTDDDTLIRVILSRCELDLGTIKRRYEKLHQKTLDKHIKSETSGDYEKILLAIVMDP